MIRESISGRRLRTAALACAAAFAAMAIVAAQTQMKPGASASEAGSKGKNMTAKIINATVENGKKSSTAATAPGAVAQKTAATMKTAEAIFAGGCFWGVEEAFRQIPGVVSTEAGYTGGHFKNPTYEDVCSDKTGHAESVRVVYDPSRVGYDDLLNAFWKIHNPTTLNRQGPDVGSQYRSAIFYTSDEQKRLAEESKKRLEAENLFPKPIVTEIVPASTFYRAEEYHQEYLEKRGLAQCHY
jgi:peptide-methionine (S)-S-oxide reductase